MIVFNRYEYFDFFFKIGNKGKINYMGIWWFWMVVEYSFCLFWFCDMSGKFIFCELFIIDLVFLFYFLIFFVFKYKKKVFLVKLCGFLYFFFLEYKVNVLYFLFLLRVFIFFEFLNMICGMMCVDFNFCVIVEERSVCYIWNGVFLCRYDNLWFWLWYRLYLLWFWGKLV